ncbi:MAG: hypothetical protein QOI01_1632, partial [Mycobacterium sp.]|nr:hypothetical protein [Mycobacterium sp.]
DDDVVIDVMVKGPTDSVAVRGDVPGATARLPVHPTGHF